MSASANPSFAKARVSSVVRWFREGTSGTGYASVALAILVVLIVVNVARDHPLLTAGGLGSATASAAPLVLLAMAVTPSMLSGRGGIDLSLGPLAGFITVLVGAYFHTGLRGSPLVVITLSVGLGVLAGAVNGAVIVLLRVQPVVATLGSYLVLTGIAQYFAPSSGGEVPTWLGAWVGSISGVPIPVIEVAIVAIGWVGLTHSRYYTRLMGAGGDDRVAYTSGISVSRVRVVAYVVGGGIAGIAGLALTSLIGGGSSSVGPPYTLVSVAAVALGGTSLAGGRGGMLGSVAGALDVFLIENLLTVTNVSVFALDIAYGAILVAALLANSLIGGSRAP